MIHNAKTPLAQAILRAIKLMDGTPPAVRENACAIAAAEVGEPDLAVPLERLLADGLDADKMEKWAKAIIPGHTDSETFVYGHKPGSTGDGLAIGGYKGSLSLSIAECTVQEGYGISKDEAKLNARRFSAAWNVCQGVPLEVLEHMSEAGMNVSGEDGVQNLIYQFAADDGDSTEEVTIRLPKNIATAINEVPDDDIAAALEKFAKRGKN